MHLPTIRAQCFTVAIGGPVAFAVLVASPGAHAASGRLNDTGQSRCAFHQDFIDCKHTGQDGESGRDKTSPADQNGRAGFSFVKVSATGEDLPHTATAWSCVKDKVTGLMWEVKTSDGGLHDGTRLFSNYRDGRAGDTSQFVAQTNGEGLCGFTDWRLPRRVEMQSLVDYSTGYPRFSIDENWFPTFTQWQWTSTPSLLEPTLSWAVSLHLGDVGIPYAPVFPASAMLVRDVAPPVATTHARFIAKGDEVLDSQTRLIWKRCSEGQAWDGETCAGTAKSYTWFVALQRGRAKGWRLPNVKELGSLMDDTRHAPAIDPVFPATPSVRYWTSTFVQYEQDDAKNWAWWIDFDGGRTLFHFHGLELAVRLVRDAPPSQ